MSILSKIRKWVSTMIEQFRGKAVEDFNVLPITSTEVGSLIDICEQVYTGEPPWLNPSDGIGTINFSKTICEEIARLATLAIGIQVEGSAKADYLQEQVDKMYFQLRHWIEYGCGYGTIILKPNGTDVDVFTPGQYMITEKKGDRVTAAVFVNRTTDETGKKYFTRLEYHRFEDDVYRISNICYVSNDANDEGQRVSIEKTPWDGIEEETAIEHLKAPLFGVFRTPSANNIDLDSPVGLPVFAQALVELQDLDIAYSRNATEIANSKKIVLLDDRLTMQAGVKLGSKGLDLPDFVKNVFASEANSFYQEINPTLNTEIRQRGIDALLSQIGFKCGFSNGYFVLDQKTGTITATQVEADDRRTIQTIKDVRDKMEDCLDGLIYAISVYADLYGLAPAGDYEVSYDMGDITYSVEEDKVRWWGYVTANKIPAWYYFVKFENMTEEEAKALVEEATPEMPSLFGFREE